MRNVIRLCVIIASFQTLSSCKPRRSIDESGLSENPNLDLGTELKWETEGKCSWWWLVKNGLDPNTFESNRITGIDRVKRGQALISSAVDEEATSVTDNVYYKVYNNIMMKLGYYGAFMAVDDSLIRDSTRLPGSKARRVIRNVGTVHTLALHHAFKIIGAGKQLSHRQALTWVSKYYDNNLWRAAGAISYATTFDVYGIADTMPGGRLKNAILTTLLMPPVPKESDHPGQVYHFWIYVSRALVDSPALNALAVSSSRYYEKDDPADLLADEAGREFADGIKSGIELSASPSRVNDLYRGARCADADLKIWAGKSSQWCDIKFGFLSDPKGKQWEHVQTKQIFLSPTDERVSFADQCRAYAFLAFTTPVGPAVNFPNRVSWSWNDAGEVKSTGELAPKDLRVAGYAEKEMKAEFGELRQ